MPEINFNDIDMEMSESDLEGFDPDCTEPEDKDEWEEYEL